MPLFSYVADLLSGRIRHWNNTNNVVANEMGTRIDKLPEPLHLIFKHLLVSTYIVIDPMLGPGGENGPWLEVELKRLTIEQFRQLYTVLLSYFVFLYSSTNSFLKASLYSSLMEVTGEQETAEGVLHLLEKTGRFDTHQPDMVPFAFAVWDAIGDLLGFGTKSDPERSSRFGILSGQAYVEAVKDIKKGWPGLPGQSGSRPGSPTEADT